MSDFKSIGGTVRARAANELRDRILTGRLAPGTRIDLDELTREFGTSRTPVREALLELSYEGLVEVTPRSGITVIGITPDDAVDNFAVLAALAGKAAEWATARITPAQLDRAARPGRRHRGRRRRGRRQPPLPPRPQPRVGLAPPAHLPPPGGAGGARPATSSCSPSASRPSRASTPRCSTPSAAATPSPPAPSPRPTCSTPAPPSATGSAPTTPSATPPVTTSAPTADARPAMGRFSREAPPRHGLRPPARRASRHPTGNRDSHTAPHTRRATSTPRSRCPTGNQASHTIRTTRRASRHPTGNRDSHTAPHTRRATSTPRPAARRATRRPHTIRTPDGQPGHGPVATARRASRHPSGNRDSARGRARHGDPLARRRASERHGQVDATDRSGGGPLPGGGVTGSRRIRCCGRR